MVQLLELENGNVILFNDENTNEEEVINCFEMGEYSSRYTVLTKRQYENIFKSKNSIIKEIPKKESDIIYVDAKRRNSSCKRWCYYRKSSNSLCKRWEPCKVYKGLKNKL